MTNEQTKFYVGQRVAKVGGSYQANGTIRAAFRADDGSARYVFRFDTPAGMLHIFGDHNLEALPEPVAPSKGALIHVAAPAVSPAYDKLDALLDGSVVRDAPLTIQV